MKRTLFATLTSLLFFSNFSFTQATVSTIVDSSAYGFTDDLIFDDSGNLYCADYSGDAIFKRTPGGSISEFATGFNTPNGLAFDSFGNLFVCDNVGNAIYKLSDTGVFLDTFPISLPSGIIKDAVSDTMIFTTYSSPGTLMKLAPNGTIVNFHSGSPLNGPVGLAYCQGELYMSNFSNREIYRVEADTLIFIAQLPGSGSLGFIANVGGQLMATAFNGNKIYAINPITQDVFLYSGGSSGHVDGAVENALYTRPNGIVANPAGDTIYISEYSGKRLRMITGFTVSTDEVFKSVSFNLYPNPTTEVMNLTIEASALPYSVTIHDVQGKTVYIEKDIMDTDLELNLSEFETGTYTIMVESVNSGTSAKKMIKIPD
ncbi:MAG: hypothetical protein COA38_14925 [Fluviicola sp.]|nr:MAG: hypothetical protein COA38_14925 [Fluviicola sp.]